MQEQLLRKIKAERKWTGVLLYALVLILVLLNIFLNLFSLCLVKGESMMPTIADLQRVVLIRTFSAKRGDVVVVTVKELNYPIIKRVIACPGETFAFVTDAATPEDSRKVYVYFPYGDGYKRYDDGLKAMDYSQFARFKVMTKNDINVLNSPGELIDADGLITLRVPEGSYFVLGDNRTNSSDSREYGFIPKKNIHAAMVTILKKDSFLERLFIFFYGDETYGEINYK